MSKDLSKINIIDLETTCEENNPSFKNEIIEIGLSVVDLTHLNIVDHESLMVIPETTKVNAFCTKLTTITSDMVTAESGALSLAEACHLLRNKHSAKKYTWGSWGDFDRRQFSRQCNSKDYPFGPTHLNIKNLFAITTGLKREVSMPRAMQLAELPLKGTHHRGVDDALNISRIFIYLLQQWGHGVPQLVGQEDG